MTSTTSLTPLTPEQLRRHLDPVALPYDTSAEAPTLTRTIGQPRAVGAIDFALDIDAFGYNLFVAGVPGSGRESSVIEQLERISASQTTPSDWVYVYNFTDADHPNAIQLPAGQGAAFAAGMRDLITRARDEVVRAFESEDYDRRRRDVLAGVTARRNAIFAQLNEFAAGHGFVLEVTPAGVTSIPLHDERPITPPEFAALPEERRSAIESNGRQVQEQLSKTMIQAHAIDREAADLLLALDRDVTLFAIAPLLDHMRQQYTTHVDVLQHLDNVQQDLLSRYQDLRVRPGNPAAPPTGPNGQPLPVPRIDYLARYEVNVLIDNSATSGAPIIIERNPTYYNLIGRIDYQASPGGMVTDFRQIKPGALHRANGGYLLLHIDDVLRHPLAWDALKRSLLCHDIRIENMGEQYTQVPTASLRPEAIPLNIKVILLGSSLHYRLLYAADEDFVELFKVKAEFAPDMFWTDEHVDQYIAFIRHWVEDHGLRHLDRSAMARVVEHGARIRDHQHRLSTQMSAIADLLTEASHWAGRAGRDLVQVADIEKAIAMKEFRSNLIEERMDDIIEDGTIAIATTGAQVGHVNGLAVLNVGDHVFGKPTRVTARVALGKGQILSIDRETELSGRIHSKGFLILSSYLAGQYGQTTPIYVSASITFEQSYDEIDGDSASSTELYALLSALSEAPIRQGIAITGSVNQYGQVQAIGGATRKIEGFFDLCRSRGLTGEQGVIIPATNVQNLMLSHAVVAAARAGQFHIWAVHTIDEGIEILTGLPAGTPSEDGTFPPNTIHHLVQTRLQTFAAAARRFNATHSPVDPSAPNPDS